MSDQVELLAAEERVGLIDGAPWIRNQFELHGLVKDLGLAFYHLQDNVQKARRSVFGEDSSEGQTWLQELLHTFKHEGYNTAWDGLTAWRGRLRSPAKQRRESIDAVRGGTEGDDPLPGVHRAPLATRFRANGIGMQDDDPRVKRRGRRWDCQNAEAMMALAALHDSGMWNQHWTTLAV